MSLLLLAIFEHSDSQLKTRLSISPSLPPPPTQTTTTRPGFSPGTTVTIVVLVSVILFMGFASVYMRRCSNSPATSATATAAAAALSIARPRIASTSYFSGCHYLQRAGLPRTVVETLPVLSYAALKARKMGKEETECSVCLGEFDNCNSVRLLPECEHAFHRRCIDMWLTSHSTCPVCRAKLLPEEP